MDLGYFVKRFAANARTFAALTSGVDSDQARHRPEPDKWSLIEIMCHLYDEERYDFRSRVESTLRDPQGPWETIRPVEWILEHKYIEQDLGDTLANFLEERERSLDWLREVESPNWDNVHTHEKLGDIRAGDLLVAWLAHDYLHIRQISNLHVAVLRGSFAPYKIDYAT